FAGDAAVDSQSNSGQTTITLGALSADASAIGGLGGDGVGSQAGGTGGDAYAGFVAAQGNAGRGDLTITGDSVISASAFGGDGGFGGSGGSTSPGANGGAGGRAIAGAITLGTVSGVDTPENDGSARFGNITGDANAFGGAGGDGGSGTTQGVGGDGGEAFGGGVGFLVRGSPATFGDVSLTGLGIGGDGGAGSIQGDGGDGYAGDSQVVVTQRFMRAERGSLTAGAVTMSTAGIGGAGATVGDSFFSTTQGAEGDIFVRQSDVTLGSLEITTSGALAPNFATTILSSFDPTTGMDFPGGFPSPISVTGAATPLSISLTQSTVNVAGDFTVFTPGEMSISLDSSALNTTNLTLDAGNFVLPAVRPATFGTINVAGALSISSGLDFRAYANFSSSGDGFFSADGAVETGDLTFAGNLDIDALGSITTGNVDASSVFFSAGQAIATGAVVSDEGIDLTAPGAISTGQLTAGDDVVVSAGGAVTVAGASAGLVNPSTDPAVEYNVVLRSLTSINAGDLNARGSVGLGSPGAIAVGNVTTGAAGIGFLALAGTGLTTGAIDTTASPGGGRVYVGNFSMESLGGELGANFDPNPVLAASPVAVNGPVAINGAVVTGKLQANAAQGLIISGATTASDFVTLNSGGGITTAAIQAANAITAMTAGAVTTGNLTAGAALTV
ncbi:MAG TPA: hypothetical protein VEC60_01840, partial [Reyranella sp.]|nr:hypothetical protein [Reyranella sp.]